MINGAHHLTLQGRNVTAGTRVKTYITHLSHEVSDAIINGEDARRMVAGRCVQVSTDMTLGRDSNKW